MTSPYLTHPPLTTRERRMLAAIRTHIESSPGPDYKRWTDQRTIDAEFRAIIAECEAACAPRVARTG